MSNPNWPRWLMASISVYFDSISSSIPLPFMVSGVNEITSEDQHTDHAELRVNGPFVEEVSKDFYHIEVEINILVTDIMKATGENAYDIQTWCGAYQEGMAGPIPIKKYGSKAGDDSTQIGCLIPTDGRRDSIRVMHFGQIDIEDRLRQSMIDGKFKMDLSNT